ncbi:branched-chain amino acid ABC transporter permease [Pigmentiphaga sp. NML080357]|uniref:branched-chain amino acid ABC transporter permease n=1 Tax=Pigmentiphaga sp. NML080357 TaxID=2008675 RepID=UPI000B4215D5|nr:branched-chain amino acid ABC transporter permease [Pigmentiphaga sp. NML080357]OVZ54331.1 branched-chain amino acid ABC transporter permease [Pigmentiphaga sp. NML080357]
MSGYVETILVMLSINVILAYAAFLPLAAGQVNLGIAGLMAIGAYASSYLGAEYAVPPGPAIAIGVLISAAVSIVIAFPILRTRDIYLALATLALGECISGIIINTEALGGAAGYSVSGYVGLPWIASCAIGVCVLVFILFRTRLGLCIVSVDDDERVADLLGIHVRAVKVAAFSMGGALAGLAGGLYAHYFSFIEGQHFTVLLSVYVVLYVLLGGAKTLIGPLAGALIFTLMPELLRAGNEWRYALFALFVIAVMAIRPHGLFMPGQPPWRRLGRSGEAR